MAEDNIIREVDDELRSERMRNLWRNFGPWLIAAAVGVVLAVAVNEGWQWWQGTNAAKASDDFYNALQLADGTDAAAAKTALDGIVATGNSGYANLARYRQAALLAQQGDTAGAVAAYDALATSERNQRLRDLALVLGSTLLVDAGDVAAVEQRVGSLDTLDNPMRNAARELIGLTKYRAGDLDGALASFATAIADPGVSQEAAQRFEIYRAQLIAEGATDPAAAAAAAAAPAAETTPSVGDAPALDVTPPAEPAAAAPATEPAAPAAPATETAPPPAN